ncbi:uncharacterized protein LOC118752382 [Rhagoletis pomonella]|uniref:uncharacterized protein LOC118752382 n=1 Tax=Rhagoletis pomonella TaxID=28610 RepID=UPI00178127AA|nr:uncharacterized protein LOC118752382 [Rhagoletis pomonella]
MESTNENEAKLARVLSGDYFGNIEAVYCETIGELNDCIDELTAAIQPAANSTQSITYESQPASIAAPKSILPKIELPKFEGTYQGWLQFKDMFTTIVINDAALSNVQRLHYLKSCTQGEAQNLLKNIPVTDNNFQIAWDILTNRFDNKRRLVKTFLQEIVRIPPAQSESAASLRKILDSIAEALRALCQLGCPTSHWNDWLIFLVTEKLDPITIRDWEISLSSPNYIPKYDELVKFLEARIQGLDTMVDKANSRSGDNVGRRNPSSTHHSTGNASRCSSCSGKHALMFCPDFRKLSSSLKLNFVQKSKLCMNCLKPGHVVKTCSSTYLCQRCQQKHHTMLHDGLQAQSGVVASHHSRSFEASISNPGQVVLATAQIEVSSATGHRMRLRALLDSGFQASFISEFAAQQLHLRRTRLKVPVTGIGCSSVGTSTGMVEITVHSIRKSDFNIRCSALILPQLSQQLPSSPMDPTHFSNFKDLSLADTQFYQPGSIDVILGADIYGHLICGEMRQTTTDALFALHTQLGWVILGRYPESTDQLSAKLCASTITELDELVKDLWAFNSCEKVESSSCLTLDEQYCEEFFEQTVRRTCSGRYIVRYPFREQANLSVLADSKFDAVKIFHYQNKNLAKDPYLKNLYEEFLSEYLRLGHMEPVYEETEPSNVCYIPHHAVYKESSSTTKLRTVFNASRRTRSGVSLNDCLLVGPKLQNDLSSIILR